MTTEEIIRTDAKKRGWTIVRNPRELGAVGVPCFLEPNVPGRCEIWVGIGTNSDALQGGLEWQRSNTHVADIRGLTTGAVYDRQGRHIGNVVRSSDADSCTISIKRKEGQYKDAWEALKTYIQQIYGGFRASYDSDSHDIERPYTFSILGEKSRDEVDWLNLVRGEKVAIVGLGGVGAWIADLLAKADVAEVHGWDGDIIEAKNVIRMPGAVCPDWIGKPKAEWLQETYRKVNHKIFGHQEHLSEQNTEELCSNTTFGFVAVDNDKGRKTTCDALAKSGIPFIDVGISLSRIDGQVRASIRITTSWPYCNSWSKAIPKVDDAGQETYEKMELPDIAGIAAGLAVQSWRKFRGQVAQHQATECMVYRVETDEIVVRARG